MLDHIFGRPSIRFRKYQVFAVVLLWSVYLLKTDRHGPPFIRYFSRWVSNRFTSHQLFIVFCVGLYVSRNFARVVGLHSPEPLASLYTRDYFRATWATTALDAGFWTAMNIRPKWLRHVASMVFTIYYLACAEQADEMVRRVRGAITVQHMRVSWDKPQTPILKFLANVTRPKFMKYEPREIWIDRPAQSDYKDPIHAWVYFDGSDEELKEQDKLVFDIPGGGFVAMNPRCHDDKLLAWAGKLGLPVVALDYKKAPEAPYPYALNECYDAYFQVVSTRGRCVGLSGKTMPKIVVSGDSAGGNLVVAMVLMLLESEAPSSHLAPGDREATLPLPEAVIAIYPALDMNIHSWMSEEQLALMRAPSSRSRNKRILERKTEDFRRLAPETPYGSEDSIEELPSQDARRTEPNLAPPAASPRTRLATTSMISYVGDRILTPEMLRAMILSYVGPSNKPDLATDYLLSPLRAPEDLLSRFPKTYLMCGERDPLSDDTVIFAGRLRQAHMHNFKHRQELGLIPEEAEFNDKKHVEVVMVEGISHGFMMIVGFYPKAWDYIHHCSRWMRRVFDRCDAMAYDPPVAVHRSPSDYFSYGASGWSSPSHRRQSSWDDKPLEIPSKLRMTSLSGDGALRRKGGARHSRKASISRGGVRFGGRRSPAEHKASIARLGSQEDILARRMMNVTENLAVEGPQTPYA